MGGKRDGVNYAWLLGEDQPIHKKICFLCPQTIFIGQNCLQVIKRLEFWALESTRGQSSDFQGLKYCSKSEIVVPRQYKYIITLNYQSQGLKSNLVRHCGY